MTASTLNVVLMRINELDEGIEVLNEDNQIVGTSKLAAKKALQETAITRALLPIPLLTIPNILMSGFERYFIANFNYINFYFLFNFK